MRVLQVLRVLGIETSCDETGVALYQSDRGVVADQVYSQADFFAAYGGVVPELASRDHIRRILPLVTDVLASAKCALSEVDAIAYTQGPGLAGALLVGASTAVALGFALSRPLIPIHHLEGHLLSPLLTHPQLSFPYLALLVSGGHTQLVEVVRLGQYRILGETIDDAAGEAFDKTAQLLGIAYPGGAALSRLAESGDSSRFLLPRPLMHSKDLDFSFSGLKTAVLHLVKRQASASNKGVNKGVNEPLDVRDAADIARAFVDAIVDVLVHKTAAAITQTGLKRCVVVGGVSANAQLRTALKTRLAGVECYFPDLRYCSDNGAMIALAGGMRFAQSLQTGTGDGSVGQLTHQISVKPRWSVEELSVMAMS